MVNGLDALARPRWRCAAAGFTYIGLLVFITLISIGLSATGMVFHQQSRREKEKQLLFAGDQIRRAIGVYYEQTPGGQKHFPGSLEDLLLDRRYPNVQRYLRRIYIDPISGSKEWVPIRAPDGGIMGVHSGATEQPLKTRDFPSGYEEFKDKTSYADWTFQYAATELPVPAPAAPAPLRGREGIARPADRAAGAGPIRRVK
ncbi:MAG: type II secretion system protein [Betaproteobacteria bacterium]